MKILCPPQVLLMVAVAAFGSVATLAFGGEQLYTFTDERGVIHFSNVPSDPRYRPVPGTVGVTPPPPKGGVAPMPGQNSGAIPIQSNQALPPFEPPQSGDATVAIPEELVVPEDGEPLPEEVDIEQGAEQVLVPGETLEPRDQ